MKPLKEVLNDGKEWLLGNEGEEGQGLVEYALILMLVAIVVIVILILLAPRIGSIFSAVTKGLS